MYARMYVCMYVCVCVCRHACRIILSIEKARKIERVRLKTGNTVRASQHDLSHRHSQTQTDTDTDIDTDINTDIDTDTDTDLRQESWELVPTFQLRAPPEA